MKVTITDINKALQPFGGFVHGDDPDGRVDVELPDVLRASSFAHAVFTDYGWGASIRQNDSVTSLAEPVVLTVTEDATLSHWHVKRHREDDDVYAGRTVFDALHYAGHELQECADREAESISIHGAYGDAAPYAEAQRDAYRDAWRSHQRAETYSTLAANAVTLHKFYSAPIAERAPIYRGADASARLLTAAERQVQKINADGPYGFGIWECPLDECAPRDDDETD